MSAKQREARRRYLLQWRHANPERVRRHHRNLRQIPTEQEIRKAGWVDLDGDGRRWLNPDTEQFPHEGWHGWVERTGYPWAWVPHTERVETRAEREYRRMLRLYLRSPFADRAEELAAVALRKQYPTFVLYP